MQAISVPVLLLRAFLFVEVDPSGVATCKWRGTGGGEGFRFNRVHGMCPASGAQRSRAATVPARCACVRGSGPALAFSTSPRGCGAV